MRHVKFWHKIKAFLLNSEGATSIEYAMIASGISITIIAGVTLISTTLVTMFETVGALF